MNNTNKSSVHNANKDRILSVRSLWQAIVAAMFIFPLVVFGQSGHEGHAMQSHSWIHWLITIAIVVVAVGVVVYIRRRRRQ